jgi:hypothetical protein|tara:strand:+ start:614 stop:847 length:234 start_codon:yes stop_codon:yes gene_type:complete
MSEVRELPEELVGIEIYEGEHTIANPYTGEEVTLPGDAAAVYDVVKGAEAMRQYTMVRAGCDWFRKNEPEAYMVLLD